MSEQLTKRERLMRTVRGEAVDRLPISLWRHFYVEETGAESLADRLVRWHRQFDFDFLKINVRGQYHTEGWGAEFEYFNDEHRKPQKKAPRVSQASDFADLRPQDVNDQPLGEMLELIERLRRALGPEEILLMTVFNPMSVAMDLAGGAEPFRAMIESDAGSVHQGLRAITTTFQDFAGACLESGADGLYFATTYTASGLYFTRLQYEEFGRPYDLELLQEAAGAFFNMLHVCNKESFVKLLTDYPVHAVHWDTNDSRNPTLQEMAGRQDGLALAGGLSSELFSQQGGCVQLLEELELARQMMCDRPFIVSATCTIPTNSREENIDAVCESIRNHPRE